LEEDGTDVFADVALAAPAFCFGFDLVWEAPFAARGDLRKGLTDLNFDFLAAILDLPCVSGSVERCHWLQKLVCRHSHPTTAVGRRLMATVTLLMTKKSRKKGVILWLL
jgi:hypothetical protein